MNFASESQQVIADTGRLEQCYQIISPTKRHVSQYHRAFQLLRRAHAEDAIIPTLPLRSMRWDQQLGHASILRAQRYQASRCAPRLMMRVTPYGRDVPSGIYRAGVS